MYGRRGWGTRGRRIPAPKGYTYIGPCRCGFGPDAFYQDPSGRVVHASQVYRYGVSPVYESTKKGLEDEIESLKEEKSELEARIEELETKLKEKEETK